VLVTLCQPFNHLIAAAPIANDGISDPALRSRYQLRSVKDCVWPRQCIGQMQVVAALTHSEFEVKYLNRGLGQSFFRLQYAPIP
jgi:hypothetical protein